MNKSQQGTQDALALLKADHAHVKQLFKEFQGLDGKESAKKSAIVAEVCNELTVHATVEEEIFYPGIRAAVEADQLDEAKVEHAEARGLVQQLLAMQPGDALYDATVTVLGEYVAHHVKEEEEEMFPEVAKSDIDLLALGKAIAKRREELMAVGGKTSSQGHRKPQHAPATHARH